MKAKRSFKLDIISIFLILLVLSFGFMLWFIYIDSSKSITKFAKQEISRVGEIVIDKADNLEITANERINISSDFFATIPDFSYANPLVIRNLLDVIKYTDNLANYYVGTPEGHFVVAYDLLLTTQSTFIDNPSKPLPKKSRFALQLVTNDGLNSVSKWSYLDEDYQTLATEVSTKHYDPRERSWYKNALKEKSFYWTEVYKFFPSEELGITVSKKIKDPNGKTLGVVGADISFILLSNFLSEQEIGKTGKVYIIDKTVKFVLPENHIKKDSVIDKALVDKIYKESQKKKKRSFVFEESDVKYLVHITDLNIFSKDDWDIIILVPISEYFSDLVDMQKTILWIIIGILIVATFFVFLFAQRISKPIVRLANEVDKIQHLDLESEQRVHSNIREIFLMDESIANLRIAVRSFTRYVPKEVVRHLMEQNKDIILGGEKKDISILFSDIKGFSTIAEKTPVEELNKLLEEYFDGMSKIVLSNQGIIDKYIGDSVMAFWGAPKDVENQAELICKTALECKKFTIDLCEKSRKENKPEFYTRIGISTGNVIVGNIGTGERMNYTVIGDAVNAAARLEQVNKTYQTMIIISENVYVQIKDQFVCRPLDIVEVKGKEEQIKIYELMDFIPESQDHPVLTFRREFSEAYQLFTEGKIEDAKALFLKIQAEHPDDYPTQIYLERINQK